MKHILGICDEDEEYADLLCENLCRRESFPFEVSAYKNAEVLRAAMGKGMISLLLLSESMYQNEGIKDVVSNNKSAKIVFLNEGYGELGTNASIWKYQSSEKIRKDILAIASESMNIGMVSKKDNSSSMKVIGVCSPFAHKETGAYCIGLANSVSKNKSVSGKVLLLSFRELSDIRNLLLVKESKDITDLIYYLRNKSNRFQMSFETQVNSAGQIDYILPAYSFVDIRTVTHEDWIKLIEEVRRNLNYDYVVIELSFSVDGILEVINDCDEVIFLLKGNESSSNLVSELKEIMDSSDQNYMKNDAGTKIHFQSMPVSMRSPSSYDEVTHGEFNEFMLNEINSVFNMSDKD